MILDAHGAGAPQELGNLGLAVPVVHAHDDQDGLLVQPQFAPPVDVRSSAHPRDNAEQPANRATPQQSTRSSQKQAAHAERTKGKGGESYSAQRAQTSTDRGAHNCAVQGVLRRIFTDPVGFSHRNSYANIRASDALQLERINRGFGARAITKGSGHHECVI